MALPDRAANNDRTRYGAGLAHCGPGGASVFFLLLAGLPVLRGLANSQELALFEAFYRSGALVFGGGHVVLPLLREAFVTPGWVGDDAFLAGYGAAQAVPGPLFTFAAYLGAVVTPSPHGLTGAVLGLIGILLPGVLVLVATLPFWESFRKRAGTQAVMRVVNAAVVGLLGAALYDPVWTSSVKTPEDFAIALVGFVLLIPSGVRRRWSSLSSARSGGSPLRSPCHDAMRSR